MVRKYLAFDIETAKEVPGTEFNWRAHRPLGITCAATLPSDEPQPAVWHGKNADGTPAARMSENEVRALVSYLVECSEGGYTILTWNGLGFDFDVLAEESGSAEQCAELAMSHVDMMFHVFCERGFPVALEKAAQALKVPGKPAGMSGMLAPGLWAQGLHAQVIDYVSQDVRIALQVARACEKNGSFKWLTSKGSTSSMSLRRGWLTVKESVNLPEPDTSWMNNPIPRRQFTQWLGKR